MFHDIDKQSINSDTIMHQLNICIQKIRDVIVLEGNEGPYTVTSRKAIVFFSFYDYFLGSFNPTT